eukprot:gene16203-19141_t
MFSAIAMLFLLPWLDPSKVRSMRYRPMARWFFLIFIAATLGLGWCGGKLPDDVVIAVGRDAVSGAPTGFTVVMLSRVLAAYYFAYFLLVLPLLGLFERTLAVPETISTPVLPKGGASMPSGATASPEKKG